MDELGRNVVGSKMLFCFPSAGYFEKAQKILLESGTIEAYLGNFRYFVSVSCDRQDRGNCGKGKGAERCLYASNVEALKRKHFPNFETGKYLPLREGYFDYLDSEIK